MKLKSLVFTGLCGAALLVGANTAHAETVVKEGDTLGNLAVEFNTTVDELARINNIADVNLIYAGEKLFTSADEVGEQATAPVQETQEVIPTETVTEVAYTEQATPVAQEQSYTGNSSSAKEWIAQRESGGDYNATNGYHIGRYQLDPTYLGGDYSPANQERVADQYVADRYGSWENAKAFWEQKGWY